MSVEMNESLFDFMKFKDLFGKMGFELIGSKELNEEKVFLVKEKRKN